MVSNFKFIQNKCIAKFEMSENQNGPLSGADRCENNKKWQLSALIKNEILNG